MAFKKRREKREIHSQAVRQYLLDGLWPTEEQEDASWEIFALTGSKETVLSAWKDLREDLLPDWIRDHPGTRPWGWWKHDAPKAKAPGVPAWHLDEMVEPRQQVGGKGAPTCKKYPAILQYYTFGIPDGWEGFNKADPPIFESEASYLKRFGLFLPGEEKRISADAYEPEVLGGVEDGEADE